MPETIPGKYWLCHGNKDGEKHEEAQNHQAMLKHYSHSVYLSQLQVARFVPIAHSVLLMTFVLLGDRHTG